MRQGEISLVGLLALFSMYLMWKSTELSVGYISGQGPGGGFWPFWLALGMLLSCVASAWKWWRAKSPFSQSDEPFLDSFGWRTLLHVGGSVVVFVALISVVSMYGAVAIFLFYSWGREGGLSFSTNLLGKNAVELFGILAQL